MPDKLKKRALSKKSDTLNSDPTLKSVKGNYFSTPKETGLIHSGSTLLNCVLGGGYPLGRMVNVVGDKSTGKTLLAMEAAANFLRKYPKGEVYYTESEAAFDIKYAEALGIPIDRVNLQMGIGTVEAFYNDLVRVTKLKGGPFLYILDSLDALSDEAEQARDITEGSYGNKAKKMSELFRRVVRDLYSSHTALMVISQIRDKIGVVFGKKHERSGGKGLDFYASQIIWLSHKKSLKITRRGESRTVGVLIKVMCEKNKIGMPFRSCEFPIVFGYGVDDLTSCLTWLKSVKGLKSAGLSEAEADKLIASGFDWDRVEYVAEKIAKPTQAVWKEIEDSFLPKRSKY